MSADDKLPVVPQAQAAAGNRASPAQDVGVDHRRLDVFEAQKLLHRSDIAVLFQGLAPPLDKEGFQVHTVAIVRPAPQPDHPLGLQVLWPRFGTSQPSGRALLNPISLGTQVDRPEEFGLLNSWVLPRVQAENDNATRHV